MTIGGKKERLIIAVMSLGGAFTLIILHASDRIDLDDFGIAGIAVWVTLIIQFYFRKKPEGESP